jgi:hypothetical protein
MATTLPPSQKKQINDTLLTWRVREREVGKKNADWFWALGILALSAAVAAFILRNVLFGILILLGSFLLALYVVKKPRTITYALTRRGVVIDDELFPYQTLASYWIHIDPHSPENEPMLLIKEKAFFAPLIIIPIAEDISPEDISEILGELLELEEISPPMAHRILELFGF